LLTTIAWQIEHRTTYALEGSVFIAGAIIQWLRDELGLIATAAESEQLATSVPDTNGVIIVPAFVGLGAPYWDSEVRGTIVGITRGANKAHIVRAALESIAYQSWDLITAMEADYGNTIPEVKADGGAAGNSFLMQFQADILGKSVVLPEVIEITALGAAYLAGLATGYWTSMRDIELNWRTRRRFEPHSCLEEREQLCKQWHAAVAAARSFRGKEIQI
jgi:glycerol kinase